MDLDDSNRTSHPETQLDFGNTWRAVRGLLPMGFIIGGFALVAGLIGRFYGLSRGPVNVADCLGLLLCPVFILAMAILPTLLFTVRIRDGQVMNVFAGHHILSQHPLSEYRGHTLRTRGCAAVLEFSGGRRMHIFAMNPSELSRLFAALDSR